MPRRKKTFACGHKGYGQSCHLCHQLQEFAAETLLALAVKQQQKQEWESRFAADPIDLRGLPKPVVLKAREIIAGLCDRRDYREFNGKRLRHDRRVISIPVNRDYRMLCRDVNSTIEPQAVVSHEDYNTTKPGASIL
jgi:hypothetical protein